MIIRIIISNPSWLGLVSVLAGAPTDSLTLPYPTLRPTLIDPHAKVGWGSHLDPQPTPRQSEAYLRSLRLGPEPLEPVFDLPTYIYYSAILLTISFLSSK